MAPQSRLHGDSELPPSIGALFRGFLGLGLMGFGGVLPLARRMIVEERRWLSAADFTERLGLCQFLPGGNIINLSVAIGLEFRGVRGAVAALFGLIAAPTVIVLVLGGFYVHYQQLPRIQHLVAGLAAAAAGLLAATAAKMVAPLRRQPRALVVVTLGVMAIAWLRLPLLPTMAVLLATSMLLARSGRG
jgi:chromate transporter